MGRVVRPVFGKPCRDCGEQVPMARIRVLEADAIAKHGLFLHDALVCRDCQHLRENEERRFRQAERDSSFIMIKR